jgi:archaellum component FlaC
MEQEFKDFKENMDWWVKDITSNFNRFRPLPGIVSENIDNIQHNYELIFELKAEVEDLRKEIESLKLIQLLSIKKDLKKVNSNLP